MCRRGKGAEKRRDVQEALDGHGSYCVASGLPLDLEGIAARIDGDALRAARHEKDAVAAYELVYAALAA